MIRDHLARPGNKAKVRVCTRTGEPAVDHQKGKKESTVQLANPGWLLLSEEERRLLQEYVKLTLIAQMEDERIEEN
jgi:hypothetical protein